jgi:integrase
MKICSPTYCCAGPGCAAQTLCSLTWHEIDWEGQEINRLTQKRKKRVVIPISQELFFALEAERDRRKPQTDERILVNPYTGDPMTRPRLYQRMLALGKRAGVPDAASAPLLGQLRNGHAGARGESLRRGKAPRGHCGNR